MSALLLRKFGTARGCGWVTTQDVWYGLLTSVVSTLIHIIHLVLYLRWQMCINLLIYYLTLIAVSLLEVLIAFCNYLMKLYQFDETTCSLRCYLAQSLIFMTMQTMWSFFSELHTSLETFSTCKWKYYLVPTYIHTVTQSSSCYAWWLQHSKTLCYFWFHSGGLSSTTIPKPLGESHPVSAEALPS